MAGYNFSKHNIVKQSGSGGIVTTTFNGIQSDTDYASNAGHATVADFATGADTANFATSADTAQYAVNANHANLADTATQADKLSNSVTIYGNEFDGTQDLTSITANTIGVENNLIVSGSTGINTNLRVSGSTYLNGILNVINNANFHSNLTVSGKTTTTDIQNNGDITNTGMITTKDLKVTGQAHFFELIIDKINMHGGATIYSVADGFKCDYLEISNNMLYLYWRSNEGNRNISNNMNIYHKIYEEPLLH